MWPFSSKAGAAVVSAGANAAAGATKGFRETMKGFFSAFIPKAGGVGRSFFTAAGMSGMVSGVVANNAMGRVVSAVKKPFSWIATGAGVLAGAPVGGTIGAMGPFKKLIGVAAALIGATAVLGWLTSKLSGGRKYKEGEATDRAMEDLERMAAQQQMMQQTMMGQQPIEGPMAQRELARRGRSPAQEPALNPGMNVVDPASVQDLGPTR